MKAGATPPTVRPRPHASRDNTPAHAVQPQCKGASPLDPVPRRVTQAFHGLQPFTRAKAILRGFCPSLRHSQDASPVTHTARTERSGVPAPLMPIQTVLRPFEGLSAVSSTMLPFLPPLGLRCRHTAYAGVVLTRIRSRLTGALARAGSVPLSAEPSRPNRGAGHSLGREGFGQGART